MVRSTVAEYLQATRSVEGWFFPIDAYLFAFLDDVQRREGIRGNLFEIGVHHGKTAIFLSRMLRHGERLGVCDVFEQQDLNRDHSGEGSRELFLANMRAYGSLGRTEVFAKPSQELTADDTTTNCRFFHIDGGHRPEDVIADLRTAENALNADGVIALDDLFNPSWPGVSEGFYRYASTDLAPILIGGNKVFFARPAAVERYARHFGQIEPDRAFAFDFKEWLGHRVLTANRLTWVDLDPEGAARVHGF